ncbi:HAE1 family efflux transporter MFP subunit [Myxococcus stipitatus DSM 14675]|uniref:HAE1 family efflux transporter MFP subunit n=1 Tax=Myxococcus stipitatus (strain DSM 14675 / JCM 12634 / Mx s8) TaxID=1278073 RepID=L7UD02_MYXSD|nr:efflux RND transporter periplasmic adaptor subunit [Myxococcus stipitatus]AGC46801.1 HAE1 family efflux transporter MFP subunit [Myxococcus stipitatus DSM 14675]
MNWRRAAVGGALALPLVVGGLVLAKGEGADSQGGAPSAQVPATPVVAAEVLSKPVADVAEFTGVLAAVHSVELRPRVGGYIESVRFAEGGLVTAGQVLFQLDARTFEAAFARVKAELLQAEERRTLAEKRFERGEKLVAEQAISQGDFDVLVAERAESRARVESAKAAVRAAEIDLQDTRVRSPVSGRVGRALVTQGNLVSGGSANATVLTTVVSVEPYYVYFDVDEATYLRFSGTSSGARGKDGRVNSVPVRVALRGEDGFSREARLDFLDNQVSVATGTARARAVLPNPDGKLTAGLYARVRLETGAARPTILIQDQAVATDQKGRYVLVIRADQTLEQRRVELGPLEGGLRVVRGGLSAGERVVLKGLARPGMKVAPTVVAMADSEHVGGARP